MLSGIEVSLKCNEGKDNTYRKGLEPGLAFCRQKPVSVAQMAETGIKYFLPAET